MTPEQEFDDFAVAAWPRLRRSAYLLTGDHHLAEDLAQTALARTYASWRRVRRADALAYARKVLVNANIDRLRRRRLTEVGGPGADGLIEARATGGPGPAVADERDEIVRLLADLTERERRVVVLRHYFDMSESEVARELRVAPGTVKSALSRALHKLRVTASEQDALFLKETHR
ncbi:SigE family RNA polymerase sigma factor [Nocardioides hankookensis]|uniref:SigE family RNA polymerase sigma factor n=1 Tax=Nocardioides hankookensis TaxID=443157 RepID=A0ABW1LI98_9ACTN